MSQTASVQTYADATGSDNTPDGYVNLFAYNRSFLVRISLASFSNGYYMIEVSNDDSDYQACKIFSANPSGASSFSVDISITDITSTAGKTVNSGDLLYFKAHDKNSGGVTQNTVVCTVTNGYGSQNRFYVDRTVPVVTSVNDSYVKTGTTVTVTGSGFATPSNTNNSISVDGNTFSPTINSDSELTFSAGSGNFSGIIIVTDLAGNSNTSGATVNIDNSAPTVSSVSEEAIKESGTAVITGTGYSGGTSSPIASVKINGSVPSGLGFVVNSATSITITGGSGEVAFTAITVTDEAGNVSTATGVKIQIDNTDPTISSVSPTIGKNGTSITITGTGFTNTGPSGNATITIGGSTTTALGITVDSYAATSIIMSAGNTEVSNGAVVVTDVAGNTSGSASTLTIDNTLPTVSAVATRYIRNGVTSVVTGTGFTDNGNATDVEIGGTASSGNFTYNIDSNTQITLTGGSTEFTDKNITVIDAASNESTDTDKLITIDNTAPTVNSLGSGDPDIIKSGATIAVNSTGGGYNTGSPIQTGGVTVGGSVPTNMTFTINSNTLITITAGSGEANGNVVVTDASGNASSESGKTLIIDNTFPVTTSISPETSSQTALKNGQSAILSGSGFNNSPTASSDATVKLGDTNFTTYGTVTVDNTGQITLAVTNAAANVSGNLKVTDFAGNETTFSGNTFYIDNTLPTITTVGSPAIKSGETSIITGTGFKTGTLESTLTVGGGTPTGMTYTVDSGTQITITAGSGEYSDGQIVITDPAGNASTDDKRLTIDNTLPTVLTVATATIKNGATSVITGTGFFTTVATVNDGTDLTLTVDGTSPAGMTYTVDSNTQITITAGTGEIEEKNIVVTDRAGNASTETGKTLTIDNTAPTISSVSVGSIKSSVTTVLTGTGFTLGGDPTSVKIMNPGATTPTGMTYVVDSNTQITITAGSGEFEDKQVVVTDAAGNASTSLAYFTIDNTIPAVSAVATAVIASGQTSVITGTGFINTTTNSGGLIEAKTVNVGGSVPTGLTFAVNSATQITITAGSGEVTSANVTVIDSAGNESTDVGKSLTIDNTAATITAISDRWIKDTETTVLTGTGFSTNGNASKITIGGLDISVVTASGGLGGSFSVDSDTKITITGGTGEVTRGEIIVYDIVNNASSGFNELSIDNTAPGVPTFSLHSSWDYGFFNNDNISYEDNPAFTLGDGLSGDSALIKIGSTAVMGRPITGSGIFSLYWETKSEDPTLVHYSKLSGAPSVITGAAGTYIFSATLIDSAGNESSAATVSYIYDNVSPSQPVIDGIAAASNFGESNSDDITNDNTPSFTISNVTVGNRLVVYYQFDAEGVSLISTDKDTINTNPFTVTLLTSLLDSTTHDILVIEYDTAGNSTQSNWLNNFTIDTEAPTCSLAYGKNPVRIEDNTLEITGYFSELMNSVTKPTISIDFPDTTDDIVNAGMTASASTDSNWTYTLSLLDIVTGNLIITATGEDKAGNELNTIVTKDTSILFLDNTDPADFTNGLVEVFGDLQVTGWINSYTDSIKLTIPIDDSDSTLLRGGDLEIQANVEAKMADTWATVNNAANSATDSIVDRGTSVIYYREYSKLVSALGANLSQGDSIRFRTKINDKVGNITEGSPSTSTLKYDIVKPTGASITSGKFLSLANDTTFSSDTLTAGWSTFTDPTEATNASGIDRFELTVREDSDQVSSADINNFVDWFSIGTDTTLDTTYALTHDKWYTLSVRAIDVAGNYSDTLNSSPLLRYNTAPVISDIDTAVAKEDLEYSKLVEVSDIDLLTLNSDEFTYELKTFLITDSTTIPLTTELIDTLEAAVSASGKITFTPTKWDTANYVFRVITTDNWTLMDSLDFLVYVLAVNDAPIINLSAVGQLEFLEGKNSDTLNLTFYSYDEDNDTTSLKWSAKILSPQPDIPGYPQSLVRQDFDSKYTNTEIEQAGILLKSAYPKARLISGISPKTGSRFISLNALGSALGISWIEADSLKLNSNTFASGDSTFAFITPIDTNFYSSTNLKVEFTVTDPGDLEGKDTVEFSILPLNDPPVWTGLRDTIITENDSLFLNFADYLLDVDDETLSINILPLNLFSKMGITPVNTFTSSAEGVVFSSMTKNDSVKFKPADLWFGPAGPWISSESDSVLIKITASDSDTSAIDSFVIRIDRVPRPGLNMFVVQNNAFTNFYEIFIIDTAEATTDLTLEIQSKIVKLDTAAAFTYVGQHQFTETQGTYTFEVRADGIVGDTTDTRAIGLALAKPLFRWYGNSPDGQFNVRGASGSVNFDQSVLIIDSTLFEPWFNDRASYLLGNEVYNFNKPVEVSFVDNDQQTALYRRSMGTGWVELPSYTKNGRITAFTEKMGYFRKGPKTLIVPGMTSLKQNYPNPFNPVTTIEYDLGFIDGPFQKVNLVIYNLLGQQVKTLVNETKGIGRYSIRWNGKDEGGIAVSSGMYFVHLSTNMGRVHSKKIMLLR